MFYRLARGAHEVCVGFSDRRDVTLAFQTRSDAVSFARSQLSLDDALRTNRLKIHGNEEVLPWLAERLRW